MILIHRYRRVLLTWFKFSMKRLYELLVVRFLLMVPLSLVFRLLLVVHLLLLIRSPLLIRSSLLIRSPLAFVPFVSVDPRFLWMSMPCCYTGGPIPIRCTIPHELPCTLWVWSLCLGDLADRRMKRCELHISFLRLRGREVGWEMGVWSDNDFIQLEWKRFGSDITWEWFGINNKREREWDREW